jgi:hypothetical protein
MHGWCRPCIANYLVVTQRALLTLRSLYSTTKIFHIQEETLCMGALHSPVSHFLSPLRLPLAQRIPLSKPILRLIQRRWSTRHEYLYKSHDEDDAIGLHMLNWKLYTSTGIVNWTDRALLERFCRRGRSLDGWWRPGEEEYL